MRRAAVLLVALVVLAAPAAALAVPTATGVRFGDHPAFVRVVVDFADGTIAEHEVTTTDPDPANGLARLRVDHAGIATAVSVARGEGLRVRVTPSSGRLRIGIRAADRRFKYVSYRVFGGDRLAIDLWKSRPPVADAAIDRGPSGCLTLDGVGLTPGTVRGSGDERNLFEHGLVAVLRGRGGGVLARKPVTAARGRWSARLGYRVARRQGGTFEAIATSAKDGSLVCLVQARVVLLPPAGSSSS